ncbi:COP9 signalosome complex subunit 7b-like [Acanthaster planci]|uniref:COP9 signalosome complex subunit 7b-like n=1 Tax=Acanthaster planci TaxID=133434 RepID=A0A8B7ZGZ6_ACAPL|nr:COP9 signalosome complex subunit 7b-like [Acanthaster planci]XP_022104146.1 COP9 signalosome complex subunit 7b-like [Acanthaster planci]XP_022104147.1 COP9 signalosome complex subunit 7b-like [Acanthaster planci]XP_022104148.1 COP9 signalosome complex subunit 7b-like [Acanthaster planci]
MKTLQPPTRSIMDVNAQATPQVGSTHQPLEQYLLLAKSTKGAAVVALIKQVLEAPGVYVFGELLEMPNVQELANGPNSSYLAALNLFAYGTYQEYKENSNRFPQLSPVALNKLRHLTVVTLAAKSKHIPYPVLLKELDMKNVRELEDLIIETIYADVIRGKLDQKNQELEIDYAIGRDTKPEVVAEIVNVLQEWCDGCEAVLSNIEDQILRANKHREHCVKTKQQIEQEVASIKKAIKASSSSTTQDVEDQHMAADTREMEVQATKPVKKTSKIKGLRGSGKLWTKSN